MHDTFCFIQTGGDGLRLGNVNLNGPDSVCIFKKRRIVLAGGNDFMAGARQGVGQTNPDESVASCNRDFQRLDPSFCFGNSNMPKKLT